MPPSKSDLPSYNKIIADLLRPAAGPVPAEELAAQMLAAHPSASNKPRQAMRQHLRAAVGELLIFLDKDTVLPLRLAYQGVRFRLPLSREIVKTGLVGLDGSLSTYLPRRFQWDQVRLIDAGGQPIPFQTQTVSEKAPSVFGSTTVNIDYANLAGWLRAQQADARDHLLFTLLDWEQGVIQLEREPVRQHDPAERAARNQLLADLFYDLLEHAAREDIYIHETLPTVYARLPDKSGYPPDHWLAVIGADKRMATDGWRILYPGAHLAFLDPLAASRRKEPARAPAQPVSKQQATQVYRFRADLPSSSSIWRLIEIQGSQSLAELDRALRHAFNLDDSDHLGGFWKLVPRGAPAKPGGQQRAGARPARYREVDLGDVDPMGHGSGAAVKIAGLGLAAGDRLKYVYDFGDWLEHHLTLEAIAPPQAGAKYPREVERNQPRYAYCVDCQAEGRQTVARWICQDCSGRPDADSLVCQACAQKNHEEHYLDEILY